ncbi:unnamed protein product, partial [Heterosigma akashiwo]
GNIEDKKVQLKRALQEQDGVLSETALALIDDLEKLNPTKDAASSALLAGNFFSLTASNYPGSIGVDKAGKFIYPLGRLSFNMFQPAELKCTIQEVYQPIMSDLKYRVEIQFEAIPQEESKEVLRGLLVNTAECSPSSKDSNRLEVSFNGGFMRPMAGVDMKLWERVFGVQQRPVRKRDRFMRWILKLLIGLTPPSGINRDGILSYEMKRAPHGYLDVLFLDETMRITKGNRGSIVVVERVSDDINCT